MTDDVRLGVPRDWCRGVLTTAVVASVIAGAWVLYRFDPTKTAWLPPCPLHVLTGLNCPGCGSTRAMHALLHGEWAAAFGFNPFAVIVLPVLLGAFGIRLFERLTRRTICRGVVPARCIEGLLAAILLFAILRNIPAEPFRLLAP